MGKTEHTFNSFPFFEGGGQMGALMREKDWSNTLLGEAGNWPLQLRHLTATLLAAPLPMLICWGSSYTQLYNDAFRPILGSTKHPQALGIGAQETYSEIWETIQPLFEGVMQGKPVTFQNFKLVMDRNGYPEDVYFDFSYSPIVNENAAIQGVLVICSETTEKVLSLEELKESNDRFGFTIDASELATWELNPVTRKFTANKRLKEWFGLPVDKDFDYTDAVAALHEEDRHRVAAAIARALKAESGGLYELEHRIINAGTGEIRQVQAKGRTIFDNKGEPLRFSGTIQDVTVERKMQKALMESEQRFKNLVRDATVGIVVLTGENMQVSVVNEAYANLIGYTSDALINKNLFDIIPKTAGVFRPIIDGVRNTGKPLYLYNKPYSISGNISKSGFLNLVYQPYKESDGSITGVMVICQDVTEQVEAQRGLEEREAELRSAIELAGLATWSLDIKSGIFTYSPRFMEWLGFSENTKNLDEAYNPLPEEYRNSVPAAIDAAIAPGSKGLYENEHPIINRLTGQTRIIHAQAQVFYNVEGTPLVLRGTAQDITLQRQLQLALEQQVQQRTGQLGAVVEELSATNEELEESNTHLLRSNEELAQFAYIASHDLQEPLRKISTYSELLAKSLGQKLDKNALHYLDKIKNSSERMSRLIRDVLHYSQLVKEQEPFTKVDLNKVVADVASEFDLLIEQKGAVLNVERLPVVEASPLQMTQLFRNLLSNALKYTKKDTTPRIEISIGKLPAGELRGRMPLAATDYFAITFSDNGIGFKEEFIQKIFNIFQRLHLNSEYEGTGIGLAMCKKIMLNHHGDINALGSSEQGAVFNILLPVKQTRA